MSYTHRCMIVALVFLDCALNVLLGGSWQETLSSRAHRMREKAQPYWYWLAGAIDWLFFWDADHCRKQYEREKQAGSVWRSINGQGA